MNPLVIDLPFPSPPIRSNGRMHWAEKAKKTAAVRLDTKRLASSHQPIAGPVAVHFIWTVTNKRRRDVGASSPTLKAALDGIVDAGVLPFDHSDIVVSETCRIEVGTKPGCRIEIHSMDEAVREVTQ